MELEVERSTATRSAEKMTPAMPPPTTKRKIEPKDSKRGLEEHDGKEVASSSSQNNSGLDVVQLRGQSHEMDRNL